MRLHFLPAEQQKRNDKTIEKLRRIGYLLFLLVLVILALGAKLYLFPPVGPSGPQLTTDDGKTIYSEAIVLAPDLVISPTRITGAAEFIAPSERRAARKVNSTTLPDGTEVTLLRLESPTSVPPVVVGIVELGDPLVSLLGGQEWHGMAKAKRDSGYSVDPEFSLSSGTAVYRDADHTSLVGFGVHTATGSSIVPAKDIVNKFAELNAGH